MPTFLGCDHIDLRVSNLKQVEHFYDEFLPALHLTKKVYILVEGDAWTYLPDSFSDYNAAEYYEEGNTPGFFVGVIEDRNNVAGLTRIAFRVAGLSELDRWVSRLRNMGARNVELSEDMSSYPALFFEDPVGTKLEIRAR